MSDWVTVSLNEIAFINPTEKLTKGTLATKIGMDNLQPFSKKVSAQIQENYNGGMKFRNGDTIVARITPCLENGKTAYIDTLKDGEIGFGSTEYIVLRAKEGLSNSHFLYYFARSDTFRDVAIASMTGSSGRQRVQTEVVVNHTFELPTLPEQKAIASVLSSLDDKIDLLHRQNKTLEAMAETLFRQWFIEEAKEDWEETKVLDVFSLVGGGTPKTSEATYWDGDIPWLSGGDIANAHQGFLVSAEKSITALGLDKSSTKLLPKLASVISARGTVGKYAMLSRPMTFSQSNYGILPKGHQYYYFVYLLLAYIVDELLAAAYGSVFDTITTRTFEDVGIKLPSMDIVAKFESEIAPIFEKKLNNVEQIQTLEKLRDTLLPKLMNGEVTVKWG
ncbi:TPA: restriction endonuclease subunit S [Acinetobacter baumannii]|uniref:restriction endonuclease subunit S n=1 Tax=Acinetobacter baumannii TaxID=470 RepID=UPI0013C88BCE|nr:restriction endonuclease subunit S [Acinetobacter baumannii]NDW26717.1 restriction endonuclease subunit S [Acinetobacter baumannii]HBM1136782.1 restriction endonuclease subunit S [Acinetobacter baumannii]